MLLVYLTNKPAGTAKAVGCRLLTTEPCVQSQGISYGFCGERSGTVPVVRFCPVTSIPPILYEPFCYVVTDAVQS